MAQDDETRDDAGRDKMDSAAVVARFSLLMFQALSELPVNIQVSVACTVLMNILVSVERFTREVALEDEAAEARDAMRAAARDAVTRIAQCYEVMQQATTVADLEQAVRLFEDHPDGGKAN